MEHDEIIYDHFIEYCPDIHNSRLQAVLDVASALSKSKSLKLTDIGRCLNEDVDIKHRVKKVDRIESNKHVYEEASHLYKGLSRYILKYINQEVTLPIIVDLCYLKDTYDIQMLSAEVAVQGRSLPLYREVFKINELKNRATDFLSNLSRCLPDDRPILIIMDAGFGEDWFTAIEKLNWYWLARVRRGKFVKLSDESDWQDASTIFPEVGTRGKNYSKAHIIKKHNHPCRIITKRLTNTQQRKRPKKLPRNYNSANGNYQRSTKEPWLLATNLPEEYKTTQIIQYYKKRMQIEESFRDIKSHQYGLGARYIQTRCVHRWSVKMLLAAIAQVMLWIIGVIGHSQDYQRVFQANTVRDKKVFSYFYLGQLIVQYNKLKDLKIDYDNLGNIIDMELARKW